jgi:UDP-hydrolysing UDP-N-acetyl-D-glucosamine 2-epimerase
MSRRIAVVTTSRADYGHLYWPMRRIQDHPDLELSLVVTAAHLSDTFGHTAAQIEADGFPIAARIDSLGGSDTDLGMAETIGRTTLGLAPVLAELRPDLLLLIADRHEMLAPASVALALRIPIAHVEGGDISEGAVDDAVRNALTKLAHLHFTPTEAARQRVLAMGEEAWRVHLSGAPSLDHLRLSQIPERAALEAELDWSLSDGLCLVSYHPVTLLQDTTAEVDALFDALADYAGQLLFCFPNADAGARRIIARAEAFCAERDDARMVVNLEHLHYWSALRHARLMVGNSSSGIMETPSLGLPCVDVGERQRGRLLAANLIHVPADADAIRSAMQRAGSAEFRRGLGGLGDPGGLANPYGDGHASERIVAALAAAPERDTLLFKRALPLSTTDSGPAFRSDDAHPAGEA